MDDFVNAHYPNATVSFTKDFRKADDANKLVVTHEEAEGFNEQTKIVPRIVVEFEANGGTPVPANEVADDFGKVTKPSDPAKDGYRFGGWCLDKACTQPFSFESDTVSENTTLYAKWTALHTMTFNSNGGTAVEFQVVEHDKTAVQPNDPTRKGCTFDGWYENKDLTTAYDFSKPVEADLTLYAKWLPTDTPKPTMSTSAGGDFVSRTTEVTYTVYQKVPEDADSLTITVDLEPVLAFSSSDVTVGLLDGGSVEASTSIEGQRLTVSIPQATDLRGKTVLVTYRAKVRDDADLSPYMNAAGTTASIPYQARTTIKGATERTVVSDVESIKVALGSGSSNAGGTSITKSSGTSSTKTSTTPKTGETDWGLMAVASAAVGVCLVVAGNRRMWRLG